MAAAKAASNKVLPTLITFIKPQSRDPLAPFVRHWAKEMREVPSIECDSVAARGTLFTIGKQTTRRRAVIGDYLMAVDDDLGLTPPGYQLPSLPGLVARPALSGRFGL